jgi:hypothetical protein
MFINFFGGFTISYANDDLLTKDQLNCFIKMIEESQTIYNKKSINGIEIYEIN